MQAPARVRIVVGTLAVFSGALLALAGPTSWIPEANPTDIFLAAVLVGLIIFADFFDIDLPLSSVNVTVSVSSALCFASALSLGPLAGAVVAGLGGLIVEMIQRRSPLKLLMNVTNYTLSTFLAGWLYVSFAQMDLSPIESLHNAAIMVIAAATYTVANSGMMSVVLSQVVGTSPWRMWRASAAGVLMECVTLPTLGALIPVLKTQGPLALVIAVVPLLGPYLAFRSYRQIDRETRNTIELLADLLDRRDPYTSEHSKRVAAYTRNIVEQMEGVSIEDAEIFVSAARIHDLGKVSTSDRVLMKPGRLTREEHLAIQRHAADGADIIGNLSMYHQAAALVRHHHERWDGNGYPDGLAGEDIPLGARVIAVADTYDAMTSERVYRPGLSHQVAMAEIRLAAGTQFDPQVVVAFERSMSGSAHLRPAQAFKPVPAHSE